MKLNDAIKLAMKNLLRTKFRSFLTILGVIIGISAIVLFVSLGLGLQKITANQIATIDMLTTITVSQKPETAAMEAGKPLDENIVNKIKSLKGVDKVSPSVSLTANVSSEATTTGTLLWGVKPENAAIEITSLKQGELIKTDSDAVISSTLANALDTKPENLIGKDIKLQIIKNEQGIDYATEEINLKVTGIDGNDTANLVYAPFEKVYQAGKFDKFSSLKVKVKSRKDIDGVKKSVEEEGFQVTTIKDLIDQIDKIFFLVQVILVFVGGIGLLVASLGIINTMTISLLERTHEIGIMKAVGATNKDIRRLFFWESALIGLFGGFSGVLVAVLIGVLFNLIINFLIRSTGQHLQIFVTPVNFSVGVIVFSMLVSIFSGLYPTFRAQKLSPMEALRQ